MFNFANVFYNLYSFSRFSAKYSFEIISNSFCVPSGTVNEYIFYTIETQSRLRDTLLFNEPCDGSSFLIKASFMPHHYLKTVGNWIKFPIFRPLSTSFSIGGR